MTLKFHYQISSDSSTPPRACSQTWNGSSDSIHLSDKHFPQEPDRDMTNGSNQSRLQSKINYGSFCFVDDH